MKKKTIRDVTTYLLVGLISGFAWSAALRSVGTAGFAEYDLPRYVFALGLLIALVSMFSRMRRSYGMTVYFTGLLLGAVGVFASFPIIQGRQQQALLILFGFVLGVVWLCSFGFFLVSCRWGRMESISVRTRPAAAPRRFGVGTLMIVILAVSVLFAVANWLRIPPPLSVWACCFLAVISGLQAIMNHVPRGASVATGAVLVPLSLAATWTTIDPTANPRVAGMIQLVITTPANFVFVTAHLAALGAVCGYFGGVFVAGLFLLIETVSPSRESAFLSTNRRE